MKRSEPSEQRGDLDLPARHSADLSNESLLHELRKQDRRIVIVIFIFGVIGLTALALLAYYRPC
jgi:hypothetical protein